MELTDEVLLSFQRLNGYPGLAHVRVLVIRRQVISDGRESDLITYLPGAWPYSRVTFNIAGTTDDPFDPQHYTVLAIIADGTREARLTSSPKAGVFPQSAVATDRGHTNCRRPGTSGVASR